MATEDGAFCLVEAKSHGVARAQDFTVRPHAQSPDAFQGGA